MNILKEYRKREEEFLKRAQDLEVVTAERDKHKKIYDELGKARLDEFMSGFNIISSKLKEMYQVRERRLLSPHPDHCTDYHVRRQRRA